LGEHTELRNLMLERIAGTAREYDGACGDLQWSDSSARSL